MEPLRFPLDLATGITRGPQDWDVRGTWWVPLTAPTHSSAPSPLQVCLYAEVPTLGDALCSHYTRGPAGGQNPLWEC
jgi:hypothetical protein